MKYIYYRLLDDMSAAYDAEGVLARGAREERGGGAMSVSLLLVSCGENVSC